VNKMTKITIQSIVIALVVLIFVTLFGIQIITSFYQTYSPTLGDSTKLTTINASFERFANESSIYQDKIENESNKINLLATDDQGTKSTFAQLKTIFTFRSQAQDVQASTQTILDFIPVKFWSMLSIIFGIIVVTLIAGLIWRYREGLW